MTQRQVTHPPGQLPRCTCGREPRHFRDLRAIGKGGGDLFECNPCDRRTGKHPTPEAGLREWCRLCGVQLTAAKASVLEYRISRVGPKDLYS